MQLLFSLVGAVTQIVLSGPEQRNGKTRRTLSMTIDIKYRAHRTRPE
jgi:hypothetical protein